MKRKIEEHGSPEQIKGRGNDTLDIPSVSTIYRIRHHLKYLTALTKSVALKLTNYPKKKDVTIDVTPMLCYIVLRKM